MGFFLRPVLVKKSRFFSSKTYIKAVPFYEDRAVDHFILLAIIIIYCAYRNCVLHPFFHDAMLKKSAFSEFQKFQLKITGTGHANNNEYIGERG